MSRARDAVAQARDGLVAFTAQVVRDLPEADEAERLARELDRVEAALRAARGALRTA